MPLAGCTAATTSIYINIFAATLFFILFYNFYQNSFKPTKPASKIEANGDSKKLVTNGTAYVEEKVKSNWGLHYILQRSQDFLHITIFDTLKVLKYHSILMPNLKSWIEYFFWNVNLWRTRDPRWKWKKNMKTRFNDKFDNSNWLWYLLSRFYFLLL